MISLITQIPEYVFTSELGEIDIISDYDDEMLDVVINLHNSSVEIQVQAYGGIATIFDIRSVIENELQTYNLPCTDVDLYIKGADEMLVVKFKTFYCSWNCDLGTALSFLENNFLSIASTKMVPKLQPSEKLYLFACNKENAKFCTNVCVKYLSEDIEIIKIHQETKGIEGLTTISIGYKEIYDYIQEQKQGQFNILWVTQEVGNRSITIYFSDTIPTDLFIAKNVFNLNEYFWINGKTVSKFEVNKNTGLFGSKTIAYGHQIEKKYELSVAPLTKLEAQFIEQLLCSTEVHKIDTNDWIAAPILIYDSSIEVSEDVDDIKMEFTWEYESKLPHINTKEVERLFTEQFNTQFT